MKVYQQILLLLALCFCTFFAQLQEFFPDLMEMRNFITAREMVQEGNWWFTTMNLEPRLEKPPLPTWLTAVSALIYGGFDSLFVLRLPAAISATVMILFFFCLLKEISKEKYLPFLGASIMATSFLIIQQGRTNSWDIYAHSFMVGSIWQLFAGIIRQKRIHIILSMILMGFSILSKGPVSLYALWIPFVLAHGIGNKFELFRRHWGKLLFILIGGLIIGFGWNAYMLLFQPEASEFVINKETNSWAVRHVRPFYFYLHFPIYIGIWSVFIITSFFYKYAAPRINKYGNYKFAVFWMLISIVLLSVIPTKKERYLLPSLIPMCLVATYFLYALIQKFKLNEATKWDRLVLFIFTALSSIAAILLPFVLLVFYKDSSTIVSVASTIVISLLGVLGLFLWKRKQVGLLTGNLMVIVCIICVGLTPQFARIFYEDDKFKPLSQVQEIEKLSTLKYYTETEGTDPRIAWLAGKPTTPVSSISLYNTKNYPLVLISRTPVEYILDREILDGRKITNIGTYNIFPQNLSWEAYVFLLE